MIQVMLMEIQHHFFFEKMHHQDVYPSQLLPPDGWGWLDE
jgi:hypothetical protein